MTFRIHNTQITLQFGFFAVVALILCFCGGEQALPAFAACAVHECGHIAAAYLCGMQIEEIRFGLLGIHMCGNAHGVSYLRRAAVSLAGPLMNFIGFLLCLPLPQPYCAVQLVLFVFHILPAAPLDGGTALYCALCSVMPQRRAGRLCTAVSVLLAFLLGVLGFSVLLRTRGNFTLLAAAMYIFIYIVLKQREDLC